MKQKDLETQRCKILDELLRLQSIDCLSVEENIELYKCLALKELNDKLAEIEYAGLEVNLRR